MIRPVAHVSAMSPYALAELNPPAGKRLVSLSQNESLRAPSPLAVKAAAGVLEAGHLYPDPDWTDLARGPGTAAWHRGGWYPVRQRVDGTDRLPDAGLCR